MRALHLCRFDSAQHLRGRARTYEAVRTAVLQAGRFSCFEASEDPGMFTQLEHDPAVERFELPYPWIGVRAKNQL